MFHVFVVIIRFEVTGGRPPGPPLASGGPAGGFKDLEETRVVLFHVFVVIIRFEVTGARPLGLPLASGGILLYLAIILY